MTPEIIEAHRKYRAAAEELSAVVAKALPRGTRVSVKIGKTTIIGTVESTANNWWYQPSQVFIRNEITGKRRSFTAGCSNPNDDAVILSLPASAS